MEAAGESGVSEFVEPSEKKRLAVLNGLSDAALVGCYWRLEDLDGLNDDERRRLKKYRHDTFGFEEYCEGLVALSERGSDDVANLTAVLDRWDAAFCALRSWHQDRVVPDPERNPVAKVLIYEESRITGVRGRLWPREEVPEQRPSVPAARITSIRTATSTRTRAARSEKPARPGAADPDALTDAVLLLAEAINRLADVIASGATPRSAASRTTG